MNYLQTNNFNDVIALLDSCKDDRKTVFIAPSDLEVDILKQKYIHLKKLHAFNTWKYDSTHICGIRAEFLIVLNPYMIDQGLLYNVYCGMAAVSSNPIQDVKDRIKF